MALYVLRLRRGGPWDWSLDMREQVGWDDHARFMMGWSTTVSSCWEARSRGARHAARGTRPSPQMPFESEWRPTRGQ